MMAPEQINVTELVGDLDIPCDYHPTLKCGPAAARWLMVVRCGCGNIAHRLACGGCKSIWISTEDAAECPACGEIFAPARKAFARIEWL